MVHLEVELRQKTCQADTNEVRRLLTYNLNINAPDELGITPLMYACYFGFSRIVSLFLQDPRIEPNYFSPTQRNTAFLLACQEGQTEVVKLMMADPHVDVNLAQTQGDFYLLVLFYFFLYFLFLFLFLSFFFFFLLLLSSSSFSSFYFEQNFNIKVVHHFILQVKMGKLKLLNYY